MLIFDEYSDEFLNNSITKTTCGTCYKYILRQFKRAFSRFNELKKNYQKSFWFTPLFPSAKTLRENRISKITVIDITMTMKIIKSNHVWIFQNNLSIRFD